MRVGVSVMAFIEAHHEQLYRYEEELCESWSECCGSVTALLQNIISSCTDIRRNCVRVVGV